MDTVIASFESMPAMLKHRQWTAAAQTLVNQWTANLKLHVRFALRAPRIRVAHSAGPARLDNSNTIVLPRFPTVGDVFAGWVIWYQEWEAGLRGLNLALLALDSMADVRPGPQVWPHTDLIRQAAMLSGIAPNQVYSLMIEVNAARGLFLFQLAALALTNPMQSALDATQAFPSIALLRPLPLEAEADADADAEAEVEA